jgi:glycosyltransferase involved in cell wall biosynthesis
VGAPADTLIQMNAGPTTGLAALAARVRRSRFIYMSMHVVDFSYDTHDPSAVNARLFEWGVRQAAQIVVQDAHQAQLCNRRFARKPVVIHSVATPAERQQGAGEAFLWVGRLQSWKRPEAYLDLARALPEAEFWMIAVPQENESDEGRRRIEAAARALPNLRMLEPRARDELGELMRRAVAIVSTSEGEGMPNVFLEAWARGVPALTLSFDPDGMIARNGLGAVAGGDPDAFAEQARALWRGRSDRVELAERCIAYVRAQHAEGVITDQWVETIERVRDG